ncbi:F-box family protein [Striga asiatica]|uniref:F-box family protein n=1 Tax=Striga asiatica TaxID=4170 RepID=A0A5A7PJ09_STRAF|nr:F-box family protein [Striga asiatica]
MNALRTSQALSSPPPSSTTSDRCHPLPFLALRPSAPRRSHIPSSALHDFDPASARWLRFSQLHLITSAAGLLYLWSSPAAKTPPKSHVVCNPLTAQFKTLPHLGYVLVGRLITAAVAFVLTELAVLYYPTDGGSSLNRLNSSPIFHQTPRPHPYLRFHLKSTNRDQRKEIRADWRWT